MLPKDFRLKNQEDIRSVLRSKVSAKTEHTLIKIQISDLPIFRIAIIISKKIFKRANKRNRIRRKVMALFEQLKYNDRLPPYISCVIQIQNKNIIVQDNIQLHSQIVAKIGLLYIKMLKPKQLQKLPN
ncbi:MAG: ribonuclease P protein component [candidate division SR1 bacterium]|nr:ribonuclease P protein component [candidate division SR1 bacterium]